MKCNESRPGFELVSPCPFLTTITITPRAPPIKNWQKFISSLKLLCTLKKTKENFEQVHLFVVHLSFLRRGIILWIEITWPENPANTYAWHKETLDSCFELIRSHQQRIPWSPSTDIEPGTTDCRAETLQQRNECISHISDTKLISHGNCVAN